VSFHAPHIDYAGLSPAIALTGGMCAVLLAGLLRRDRVAVPGLTLASLGVAGGLAIWQFGRRADLVSGALRLDELALIAALIAIFAAAVTVLVSLGEPAVEQAGRGEYHALLLASVLGMTLLAQAQNLVTLFVSIELLSIPLYVLCATNLRRAASLESGLKYLVVGSLGSATLLYGLAFIYGGAGSTDFGQIAAAIGRGGIAGDPLVLVGIALAGAGLAFKISIAPFHQWTPDVYEGAPTPVTGFMAVATKAAAFAVFARFFEVALAPASGDWDVALAVLAAASIVVGNVGALGQSSLKRLLGWSGVAQAGYMLTGLLVATKLGLQALAFYLAAYALINLAAFAVIAARERETPFGDDIRAFEGLGRERPLLAWPLTSSMLGLAGLPGTVGFVGKLYLIEAAADDTFTWLAVLIAIGTMISLAYYLRVVAAIWMRPAGAVEALPGSPLPAMAGGEFAEDPRAGRRLAILLPALLTAGATVFFGVIPSPLVHFAQHAGAALLH
jgi:NADH-quinone oxidoreductase subunit N